ncbi:MAG: peptide chain release factor N(5)-glutamine methyltransferase [Oscillospiraceae bacterium]
MIKCVNFFKEVEERLKEAGIQTFEFESRTIFFEYLGESWFTQSYIPADVVEGIKNIVARRCEHYPLQYLLGHWEFWGLDFFVGPGVLIPRPETELLVEEVLKTAKTLKPQVVVDLFSGSGCVGIAIAKELENTKVFLIEKSKEAFKYAEKNLMHNNILNAQAICADALQIEWHKKIDIIVANPPYLTKADMNNLQTEVQFEPRAALFGGTDGLEFYRASIKKWSEYLNLDGRMIFEVGYNQAQEVLQLFSSSQFKVEVKKDLVGKQRCVVATKKTCRL